MVKKWLSYWSIFIVLIGVLIVSFSCVGLSASSIGVNLNTSQEYFTYGGVQYSKNNVYEYDYIQFSGNNIYDLHSYNIDISGWGSINNNGGVFTSSNNVLSHSSYDISTELSYNYDIVSRFDNVALNNIYMYGDLSYISSYNEERFSPRYMWVAYSDLNVYLSDLFTLDYNSSDSSAMELSYTQRVLDFSFGENTQNVKVTAYYDIDLISNGEFINYTNNSGVVYDTLSYTDNRFYYFPTYSQFNSIVNSKWVAFEQTSLDNWFLINKLILLVDFGESGFQNELIGKLGFPWYTYEYVSRTYSNEVIYEKLTENVEIDANISQFGRLLLEGANAFLAFELIPGISLYLLLGLCVAIPLLIYILKLFLGGQYVGVL